MVHAFSSLIVAAPSVIGKKGNGWGKSSSDACVWNEMAARHMALLYPWMFLWCVFSDSGSQSCLSNRGDNRWPRNEELWVLREE